MLKLFGRLSLGQRLVEEWPEIWIAAACMDEGEDRKRGDSRQ